MAVNALTAVSKSQHILFSSAPEMNENPKQAATIGADKHE